MRISKAYLHSFGILLLLNMDSPTGYMKSADMAERLKISESSLKKSLRMLVVAGILDSSASKDGGFKLAKPLSDVSIGDIVRAVEGPDIIQQPKDDINIYENIFGAAMPNKMPPFANTIFDAVTQSGSAILSILDKISMADVYDHCVETAAQAQETAPCALSS